MIALGKTIKRFREEAKISQTALAAKIGVNPTFLSAVENDRREPSFTLVRRICRALSVPAEVFFWEAIDLGGSATPRERKTINTAKALLKNYYRRN